MNIKTFDASLPDAPPALTRGSLRAVAALRERIETGFYSAGEFLPTERTLAEDLRVHRRVVRAAIDELVREGMISQKPHCRPVVGQPADAAQAVGVASTRDSSALPATNLIALILWHDGGRLERASSPQARIFWSVNDELAGAGYHAVFLDMSQRPESEDMATREAALLNYALDQGFGGVIFYPYTYRSNRDLVKQVSQRIPLVLLDRTINGVDASFVGVDNYQSMFEITEHLLSQGHRRIAHITENDPIHPVQERLRGYIDAVRAAGAPEMVVTTPSNNNPEESWPVVDAIFRLPMGERPTAAVCLNDYTAVHLTTHLKKLGLMIPADVAVTGFDNVIQTLPGGVGLTTMAQPFEDIGQSAAQILIRRLKNPLAPTEFIELPARLTPRASTPDLELP
ncbi:MAG: GntR family transcriptional regulator [Capsulimonas sp.]|uniref:GntR family transcriptional regulator n=1 Tax=Capsulimonas sp. TaxID=2494211 RepID=UPI00326651B0